MKRKLAEAAAAAKSSKSRKNKAKAASASAALAAPAAAARPEAAGPPGYSAPASAFPALGAPAAAAPSGKDDWEKVRALGCTLPCYARLRASGVHAVRRCCQLSLPAGPALRRCQRPPGRRRRGRRWSPRCWDFPAVPTTTCWRSREAGAPAPAARLPPVPPTCRPRAYARQPRETAQCLELQPFTACALLLCRPCKRGGAAVARRRGMRTVRLIT